MSKLIVIVGVTGQQGGSVAEVYSKESGWKVRGITRDPNSAKSEAWKAKGVEVVQGDLGDKASLEAAFQGAHAIFSTTDFWGPFYNPATQKLLKSGQNLNQYCYDLEVSQGKNVTDAAATIPTLERYIISSLCDAKKASKGKYTWVYHFDSKAHNVEYVKSTYPELAAKMSIVEVASYMSNLLKSQNIKKQEDGTYRFSCVGSGTKPIPHFDTEEDLGYVVRAALQTPPGKNILAAGSVLSWSKYFEVWCKANGVKYGGYDEIPLKAFIGFIPMPGLGEELGEMLAFMDEFGYTGDDDVVLPQDLGVPCPLTTWEAYVKKNEWSKFVN